MRYFQTKSPHVFLSEFRVVDKGYDALSSNGGAKENPHAAGFTAEMQPNSGL